MGDREPGMMWRYEPGDADGLECWWIVLPNTKQQGPGYVHEVSWRTTDRASRPPHERWTVTGQAPNLTVTPSIDVECWLYPSGDAAQAAPPPVRDGSYWHGFIRNGELVEA